MNLVLILLYHFIIREMLELGSSKPWPDAMELLTGQRKMDVQPILEYFKPLIAWLEKENYNERPGWSPACPEYTSPPSPGPQHTVQVTSNSNCETSAGTSIVFDSSIKCILVLGFIVLNAFNL